ncbi:hypothetical protein N8599_01670 [Verrucomicrobiales bacterium]|nr:hypothetical protein [Verrucomicrobiales bacterium]
MKERFLITLIPALLFSAFNYRLLAQDQNKSLNDVKDIKKFTN